MDYFRHIKMALKINYNAPAELAEYGPKDAASLALDPESIYWATCVSRTISDTCSNLTNPTIYLKQFNNSSANIQSLSDAEDDCILMVEEIRDQYTWILKLCDKERLALIKK